MKKVLSSLRIKNFLLLTIAGIVNAFGITVFLSPVNLYDSGISGTSMLIDRITPDFITLSIALLALNIPLFAFGLKRQGPVFTIYAIYTVAIYSAAAWMITDVIPIDVTFASPLAGQDLLLCALFGGVISGVGSGLAIRAGGAMDGVEVMAVIFAKRLGITVGTFVMIYNVILYVICGIVLQTWILPLYSIVTYFAGLKTIDFIIEGIDRAKSAMIITTMPDEISEKLSEEFGTGTTKMDCVGGYLKQQKAIVYFVTNRFQLGKVKSIVHGIDPAAYITITDVADVFKQNN